MLGPEGMLFMKWIDITVILTAIVLCAVLLFTSFGGGTIETASWGLSFPGENQTPSGPASAEQLSQYDAAYLGDTSQPVIYLTFDAGYENGCTAQILDTLKAHDAPAAFFLVGNYIEKNADLVRRMIEEGHTVGNHTMHHPDMSKIEDFDAFSKELSDLEALYEEITGEEMAHYYRPPQGVYSQSNLEQAQKLGYKTVFWSLAYADWDNNNQPTREAALEKLMTRIHNGAVVLLHSTSKTNAQILDDVLTKWEEMGYQFGDIEELFEDEP